MKILLLVSAFNALSQRVWCTLRRDGHDVTVQFALDEASMISAAEDFGPDLILCPYLKARVPHQVWSRWRTIIVHPGPVGDRGPSSLDWAIMQDRAVWGVTALQAVEAMDAGPVWASRTFPMPNPPLRKSALYNGPVADAALDCITEVLAKASDPAIQPVALDQAYRPVADTGLIAAARQSDRQCSWAGPTRAILQRIRAADGSPGLRTQLAGVDVYAYDAHLPRAGISPGTPARPIQRRRTSQPGTIVGWHEGAVEVATGDGSIWIGQLRLADPETGGSPGIKLPAAMVLAEHLGKVRQAPAHEAPAEISYRRRGQVGELRLDVYNGAMSTTVCDRIAVALHHALGQSTRVLVLRGNDETLSNGINLNTIQAAANPAAEAWANIRAINTICRHLTTASGQVTIAAFSGNAGAGGVMLALGADLVVARDGIVLNPYYTMGLAGSELHTLTLPLRVGAEQARRLLDDQLPLDAPQALDIGLVDMVGPRPPQDFDAWLAEVADRYTSRAAATALVQDRRRRVADASRPLDAYEAVELGRMARDMFDDAHGFHAARAAFVGKRQPDTTPARLARHRTLTSTALHVRSTRLEPAA